MRWKRNLYKSKHPFNEYPFEAFYCDAWQPVERISIMDGIVTMHLTENQTLVEEKRPFTNLRVRSRKATLPDCTCFLRPGIDVCVLSQPENAESSDNDQDPIWVDAKLSSVERKPHDTKCSCQFYFRCYVNQGPLGSEKGTLSKDTKVVGIDQITILQRLEKNPCDDQNYRWKFSEDCSSLQKTKLLLGKFSSDLSWLVAAAVLKQTAFDVISVEGKIVYQILDDDEENCSSNSVSHFNAINFKDEDGMTTSHVFQFAPTTETVEKCPSPSRDKQEAVPPPFYEVMNLRRSKRRMVQPDRFLGCDVPPGTEVGWVRMFPIKNDKSKAEEDDDLQVPLQFLLTGNDNYSCTDGETRNPMKRKRKRKHREVKWDPVNQKEGVPELAIIPVSTESEPIAFYQNHIPPILIENGSKEKNKTPTKQSKSKGGARSIPRKKVPPSALEEDMDFASRWETPTKKVHNKDIFEEEDMVVESRVPWGKFSNKNVQRNRYRPLNTNVGDCSEKMIYKRPTLSDGAYNRLINSYMKNIDSTVPIEETSIIDQWNQFKASNSRNQRMNAEQFSSEDEEELSETEMLWKEMELCMASAYIMGDSEDEHVGASVGNRTKSHNGCQHDYRLDEEVGIQCRLCGFVSTEIKYVTAPFLQQKSWTAENKMENKEGWDKPDEDVGLNIGSDQGQSSIPLQDENENVWALIPDFKMKLHLHQKKAFEFLWKTIAGSMVPTQMQPSSKNIGGCVISHSPGAGKTFLIIAFLTSYLKLFPGKRPLVLAPKTTLYTWYKEFIKWQVPIPVHLIHGRRTYNGVFKPKNIRHFHGGPRPNNDVMHVLDCLEKIQKWHAQPSVLVMGYTSFLTLMREDSKFAHRKYMAKVLRESPGILVLDEGHNPRSTKSRLRKVLMKVETDLRILLSGTLFQNNFCEYFNTLSLARPKFINEVLTALDPKFKRRKKLRKKARHLLESRARKFFLDTIAKKIDSDVNEERMDGLNMLRNMTSGFIDVYEGGGGSDVLPGLQIYTLLMNSTNIQHEVLGKLHRIMATYNGYPLELELLITLASIHPWLVKTSNCVSKFFNFEELLELEKIKFNIQKGSKVLFVLNLVQRVVKQEKVLIFCHNIAPIILFVELFERIFRWRKGREILVLTGDQELFERGRIMDKFEEPGGSSRVLLASITACAEGISLTSASRVVMLDSEWNPSKTKQAIARAFRPGQQKVVYVYQLLAAGSLEEAKYRRTTWKEWVSCMIFSEAFVEDPSRWQAEKIEDDVLREIVADDKLKSFHMIMKNEKASTGNRS